MTGGACLKGTRPQGLGYQVHKTGTILLGSYNISPEDFRDMVEAVQGDAAYLAALPLRAKPGKPRKTKSEE